MKLKLIFLTAALSAAVACGQRPAAVVENVDIFTSVGDNGFMVDALEVTVQDARSLKGITAADFDLVNNVAGGFIDPATGEAPADYADDGISVSRKGNVLRIEAKPFNMAGRSEGFFRHLPWELRCAADSALTLTPSDVNGQQHIAVIDDCIKGSFTFAGITREYMLHLPKDAAGNYIPNVPLMVWQIGGGEYDKDLMTAATANRCLVSLAAEGIPCAALVFAIANPNY